MPEPRYLALIVAGVLIVGGGAAYGAVQLLSGDDSPGSSATAPAAGGDGAAPERPKAAPVDPAGFSVSVLNGTTVNGLAGVVGDKAEAEGFKVVNKTNFPDQTRAESAVLYADGAAREARAVARKLGISQIEPIDAASQELAGPATVVVVAGADQEGR